MIAIQETAAGLTFAIRVQPRARRDAIIGELGEALKVALSAPAVDGRANEACIAFLAEMLQVQGSSIRIVSGQRSRNKVIRVVGISAQDLRNRLDPLRRVPKSCRKL